jgi:predicted ATP-binding protein involved in virulence
MDELFIQRIRVEGTATESLDIQLSAQRKHLIITGKNGSGKTTFLMQLRHILESSYWDDGQIPVLQQNKYENVEIAWSRDEQDIRLVDVINHGFLLAVFEAKRQLNFLPSEGVHKLSLSQHPDISRFFLQYIVNLKAERSFARDDGDEAAVQAIDDWFQRFEARLKDLFDAELLELVFDRKNYNFLIQLPGQEPFGLSELSDGYSAVMRIITEIMLRMEAMEKKAYDAQGVVLIDEVETHLHVELQKKILPFLCDFFPRIQFIVSTHSPFVLSSIENAVICDLQNHIVTEDLSGYSYDTLIESYFKSDKYSTILKNKVDRYEALADMPERSDAEMDEYFALKHEFDRIPKYFAPELEVKLQQIHLKHLA